MAAPSADPTPTFLDSLGARSRRRAEPRTSIVLAGAGCALAVLGVLIVAGDTGSSGDEFNRFPGILLSALVIAGGLFTLNQSERGAIATGGAVAAALGFPPLLFFLTVDEGSIPPYSTEAILLVPTLAWLALYAVGPGRGRPVFLGLGLIGLWAGALQVTEKVFDAPYLIVPFFFGLAGSAFGGEDGSSSGFEGDASSDLGGGFYGDLHIPDLGTIGLISLLFGIGYLVLTRWLDRRGHHGTAQPFALTTIPALVVGTLGMIDDLEQAGSGLLMLLVGSGLAYHGATTRRRGTAWFGGALAVFGAAVFLSDMADDPTIVGMLFLTAGIGIVFAGHGLSRALDEPDELTVTDPALVVAAAPAVIPPPPGAPEPDDDAPWRPPEDDGPPAPPF